MSVDVTVSAVIACPRDRLAAYCCDPDNDLSWYDNIKEVTWITDKPAQVGTKVARVAQFMGKRIAYTYLVEELVPGERLVMRAVDSPFPMTTTYTWRDVDGGTHMDLRNQGEPTGFFGKLTAGLMARQMRSATTKDLAKLKGLMEA
jgi:hypothetical protein